MKKAKRLVSIVLALAMVLAAVFTLAACAHNCEKKGHLWGENGKCTVCGVPNPDADNVTVQYYTTHYNNGTPILIYEESVQMGKKANGCGHKAFTLNGGLKDASGNAFDVATTDVSGDLKLYGDYVMTNGTWIDDSKSYTWRSAPSDLPTNWNIHDYETASATYVLDYTSDALYTFDYNEDYTAYRIVPSMASGDPIDVTEDYLGQFGIPMSAENGEGYAYKIPLKSNLRFDDGSYINANTFVSSVQNLLNPKAMNFRADNLYSSGNLQIVGAEAYVKGGNYAHEEFVSADYGDDEYYYPEDISFGTSLQPGNDTVVAQIVRGGTKYDITMNINNGGNWGSDGLVYYADSQAAFAIPAYALDKSNGGIIFEGKNGQIGTCVLGGTEDEPTETYYDLEGGVVTVTYDEKGNIASAKDAENNDLPAWKGATPFTTVWQFDATLRQYKLFNDEGEYIAGRSVYADAEGNYTYYDLTGAVIAEPSAEVLKAVRIMNNMSCYTNLVDAADEKGNVILTESLIRDFQDCIAILHGFEDAQAYYDYYYYGYLPLVYEAYYPEYLAQYYESNWYQPAYVAKLVALGYTNAGDEDFDNKTVTEAHAKEADAAGKEAVLAASARGIYQIAYDAHIKALNLAEGTEPTEAQLAAAHAAGVAAVEATGLDDGYRIVYNAEYQSTLAAGEKAVYEKAYKEAYDAYIKGLNLAADAQPTEAQITAAKQAGDTAGTAAVEAAEEDLVAAAKKAALAAVDALRDSDVFEAVYAIYYNAKYAEVYAQEIANLNLGEDEEPTAAQVKAAQTAADTAAKAVAQAAIEALTNYDVYAVVAPAADTAAKEYAHEYAHGEGSYAWIEYQEMATLARVWEEVPFSQVGFLSADEGSSIVIFLIKPMEDNFYLRYELCTSFFLVNNNLYDQCESTSGGVYTSSYGTSVATYSGFGPYKLVEYVAGSKLRFERNPYWHGYSDINMVNQYQTSAVEMNVVTNEATRLEMFLKGEVEGYGLTAKDMDDYITSPYIYYQDSESTWFVAMNPQVANLDKMAAVAKPVTSGNTVIKAPLAIDEFRQALSYSLDRTAFILACSPTSGIAKALLSSVMIADPEDGTPYRNTIEAQDAILNFWGLSDAWGEGKEYASRAEAIASITGYDLAGAKVLFTTAYNKAVEAGYIPTGDAWEMQICIGLPSTASFYTDGYAALSAGWTDAVKGTPWEGHLTFVQDTTLTSSTFADALHSGTVDLLFGVGYSGSMFDPYSFMECFTGSLQYDVFTDMSKIDLDIEIDGSLIVGTDGTPAYTGKKVLRGSIEEWVSALQGNKFDAVVVVNGAVTEETVEIDAGTSAHPSLRLQVMADAETAILNQSNLLPLMTDASASLRSMRVIYKTEDYILGVGRGGIQYYTYLMDDAEWAAYVAAQGGTLNYKG